MNDLQTKQLKFLNDTIEYYRVNPRGVDGSGMCNYTKGCAIGRHLPMDLRQSLDDSDSGSIVQYGHIFNRLPDWMKELGQEFLYEIQNLHDHTGVWIKTDSGNELSERGLLEVKRIKKQYGLGEKSCVMVMTLAKRVGILKKVGMING